MATGLQVLDALAPDAAQSNFPFPRLVTSFGPAGSFVSEGPLINGQTMPGQWLLIEATRVFGWELRIGNYLSGATLVPSGDPLLVAKYAIKLWNSADMAVYLKLLGTTLKKPVIQVVGSVGIIKTNASTAVLGIDDPCLKAVGVTQVVVKSVTPPFNPLVASGGKGAWTASAEFWEYRKPVPALPIPDQTIPDNGAVTPSAFNMKQQEDANMTQGGKDLQGQAAQKLLNH